MWSRNAVARETSPQRPLASRHPVEPRRPIAPRHPIEPCHPVEPRRLVEPEEPVFVEDTSTETRFTIPEFIHAHGVRSGISTAIYGKTEPYGVLEIDSVHPRRFTEHELRFLQSVANIVDTALERKATENRPLAQNAVSEGACGSAEAAGVQVLRAIGENLDWQWGGLVGSR
jgi:GAF domain-containing protein